MEQKINPPEKLNPWATIWTRPRDTMRYILHTDPKGVIIWLAIISGIISSLAVLVSIWARYPQREIYRFGIVIAGFFIGGAILGIIQLYFSGWLFRITGNWLGGKGTFTEVKAAVGWSYYPLILAGILNILSFFLIQSPVIYYIITIIHIIIAVWAFIISLKLLGEAHSFSAWRALGTMVLAAVLIIVAVMIIVLIISLIAMIA